MEVLLSDNSIQYPGSDPQIDDPYKGICIVHAIYKGSNNFIDYSSSELKQSTRSDTINPDILKSELTKIDTLSYDLNTEIAKLSINNKDIFYHDFNNFFPDKQRIYRGSGFIRTLNNKQYVITCNHIMVKYASYVGYCTNVNSTIICFNMIIYKRIPELDIVIMEISSKLDYPLPDIPFEYPKKINKMTEKETHNHNILISGEYNPNNIEKPVFKKIELNTDIIQEFDILKSTYIHDIPIISIPVHEILSIKKILNEYKLDITQYLNITFLKKQNISQKIADVLSGTSGSIIRSNNNNIGMCCLYADSSSGIFLKALPLFLIDIIVKNTIFLNQNIVLGIQVDTYPCDIEYMKEHFYAQYVVQQSCNYINGKKMFTFNEGDIIIEVDGQLFDNNKLLYCNEMQTSVPLNTYLMIKSNILPGIPITIKIAKQYKNDSKIRIHNLLSIPYNEMFHISVISKLYCRWNNIIFIELSEEFINFYKRIGIDLIWNDKKENIYSLDNEKHIILFNYKKKLENIILNTDYYVSMPYIGKLGYYFYQLKFVGQKKINHMNELIEIINYATINKKKKLSFKLCTYMSKKTLIEYII